MAPNPDLEPEKSKSYETGLRGNFEQGSFDVAVFYNKYRDFINERRRHPRLRPRPPSRRSNIKHATIKGAEVKGRSEPGHLRRAARPLHPGLDGLPAYGRNNDSGEPLNSVNPLTGVFGLGYDQDNYGGLLSWTLVKKQGPRRQTATSRPRTAPARQFKTPGFGILDLAGFYKVTDDVTVSGRHLQPDRQEVLAVG